MMEARRRLLRASQNRHLTESHSRLHNRSGAATYVATMQSYRRQIYDTCECQASHNRDWSKMSCGLILQPLDPVVKVQTLAE